jgi:hypothetical protein
VEAPEGTEALAIISLSVIIMTSRVGLPRESNISIALTDLIYDIITFNIFEAIAKLVKVVFWTFLDLI